MESKTTTLKKVPLEKRGNFIFRQELNSYTPTPTVKCGIISNFAFLLVCLAIGIPSLIYSEKKKEIKIEYTKCYENRKNNNDNICTLYFVVDKTLNGPLFLYYELNNFFMNHRKFVKSKIWAQLRGEEVKETSTCENAWTMKEMFGEESVYYTNEWGHTFQPTDPANPCGLFARAFFNDTYTMYNNHTNSQITIDETKISNKYLREKFFKRNKNYQETQWIDVQNEHFINWMNVETFDNFRKLWGRIPTSLPKGSYKINVVDNYNVTMYKTKKFVVITDSNPLGENNFFGWLLIAVSIYCFLVTLILWVIRLSNRDKIFQLKE